MYMSCADMSVLNVVGGNSNPISVNFETLVFNYATTDKDVY